MCIHSRDKKAQQKKEAIPDLPFSEYYETIVETYSSQIKRAYKNKNGLKFFFFFFVVVIMAVLLFVFIKCLCSSYDMFTALTTASTDSSTTVIGNGSTEVIAAVVGPATALVSSCVSVILAIFKLPEIIAKYLFSEKEDDTMCTLISNIQNYTLIGYAGSTLGNRNDNARDLQIKRYAFPLDKNSPTVKKDGDQGESSGKAATGE